MSVHVYKAKPSALDHEISDLHLVATKEFPDIADRDEALHTHEVDAAFIVSALLASLPGGTVDAVLRKLLEHHASLLRVPWQVS